MPAPIALFAFNRPNHLHCSLAALSSAILATESDITIFCDGPRTSEEKFLTDQVRACAGAANGFHSVRVVAREKNMGCANAIISGLQEMFALHEQVIVMEDDIICSPYTLIFLNTALQKYAAEQAVFNISAWSPPARIAPFPKDYPYDAYFVPRFNCWGWASWRDRFNLIDWDVTDYEQFSQNGHLRRAFNQGGDDMSPMLQNQMNGKLNTWDIRMDYARFKHGLLGMNPIFSYTTNIGVGAGTHGSTPTSRFDNDLSRALPEPHLPDHIFIVQDILSSYRKIYAPPLLPIRAINKVWRMAFSKNLFDR